MYGFIFEDSKRAISCFRKMEGFPRCLWHRGIKNAKSLLSALEMID